ncbi:immune inhibitor A [Shewanella sp. C32]|uniref:Immune inhibitor A n=1 Tax=Shewanella electrica TaxID=515560 RepID=A0ABT2FMT0_9GAMM|nr:immune inhibitor A domain-containing protein [Shewanella electrica]MCH1925833.1 immune inhibitor A [Shewanella electrica]MCS4557282.1 immune inhibitor A [Shewanella electrica]
MSRKWMTSIGLAATLLLSAAVQAVPAPADTAIQNNERILYWLEKHGELSANASEAEKQQALQRYINRNSSKDALLFKKQEREMRATAFKAEVQRSKLATMQRAAAQAAPNDVEKTVKVLVVLIDFPDLPHDNNGLTAADTPMYFNDYPASHYNELLFSETGMTGPSGQNLQSAYQYYQAASGETFHFTGTVKGWYRAQNNAAYYGENDTDTGDDLRATELVTEAVTAAVQEMTAAELAQYDVEDPYDFDNDGNLDEPDGIIDHVMVFHSSIGEEAGGGNLLDKAIWSHRFVVSGPNNNGYAIPGTDKRLFGYTIQPIDAGVGVCVHEFGHDLGLPDEYDTANESALNDSPVGLWSLMAAGNWTGALSGSQPSSFSPYARSFLQERYQGRWLNEQEINYAALTEAGQDYRLTNASDSSAVNQLAINLPQDSVPFNQPFAGQYQYYSGRSNDTVSAMSFELSLPTDSSITLQMQARWDIEEDYDYVQVRVGGVAIAGNHTKASNSVNTARNIITGKSSDLSDADARGWVTLSYDLSAYAGSSRQISIVYTTDPAVLGSGFQLDNLQLLSATATLFSDDAEQANSAVRLTGFSRIQDKIAGQHRYLVQLRNYSGNDAGLRFENYEPGVLVWYENANMDNNDSSAHPGYNLISVVDADQQMIANAATETQLRDASFSMYDQTAYTGDRHLGYSSVFDDRDDYRAPSRPTAGVVLPELGVIIEVTSQEQDSSAATVNIRRAATATPEAPPLVVTASQQVSNNTVAFTGAVSGGAAPYQYRWNFGDGGSSTALAPSHTYANAGSYSVVFSVTDSAGATANYSTSVTIAATATTGGNEPNVNAQSSSSSGGGSLSAWWLLLLAGLAFARRGSQVKAAKFA